MIPRASRSTSRVGLGLLSALALRLAEACKGARKRAPRWAAAQSHQLRYDTVPIQLQWLRRDSEAISEAASTKLAEHRSACGFWAGGQLVDMECTQVPVGHMECTQVPVCAWLLAYTLRGFPKLCATCTLQRSGYLLRRVAFMIEGPPLKSRCL